MFFFCCLQNRTITLYDDNDNVYQCADVIDITSGNLDNVTKYFDNFQELAKCHNSYGKMSRPLVLFIVLFVYSARVAARTVQLIQPYPGSRLARLLITDTFSFPVSFKFTVRTYTYSYTCISKLGCFEFLLTQRMRR